MRESDHQIGLHGLALLRAEGAWWRTGLVAGLPAAIVWEARA